MRILFDQGTPVPLREALTQHDVVQMAVWNCPMRFEWDSEKAAENVPKHRVSLQSAIAMKPRPPRIAEMRAEYDFSNAVRGKHLKRLTKEGSNVVVLDPDIAKAFPDSASVNEALRVVLKAGRTARGPTTRSSGPGTVVGRSTAPRK